MKNCGSCKWLDVPEEELTKQGRTHKRRDFYMYQCKVPFATYPSFPACIRVTIVDSDYRATCPSYGSECAFHEERQKVTARTLAATPAVESTP